MKKISKLVLFIILVSCFNIYNIYAQQISASASSSVVGINVPFSITIVIENANGQPTLPNVENLKFISRPSTGTSITFINGNVSKTLTYTYQAIITKEGEYIIPPFEIEFNGEVYKTDPINIEANEDAPQAQNNTHGSGGNQGGSFSVYEDLFNNRRSQVNNNSLFLSAFASKTSVYVGEPIYIDNIVFTSVGVELRGPVEIGTREGFWVEALNYDTPQKKEMFEGREYITKPIYREVLFPLNAGDKVVGEIVYSFFDNSFRRRVLNRASKSINIKVKPLPTAGKPKNFSGAVGDFNIELLSDNNSVKAGDAVLITIKVSGEGNLHGVAIPDVSKYLPDDVKLYESKEKEELDTSSGVAIGEKTTEYVVVPFNRNIIKIPSVSFSYFNPSSGRYITKRSNPLEIEVEKGDKDFQVFVEGSESGTDNSSVISKDIRHLKSDLSGKSVVKNGTIFKSPLTYIYLSLLIGALLFVILYKREEIKLITNVAYRRRKRAKSLARKRLKKAYNYLEIGNDKEYYSEIQKSITLYLTNKLNLPYGSIWNEIEETLIKNDIDEDKLKNIKEILEECDYAVYTPQGREEETNRGHYNQVLDLILGLEEIL